MKKLLFISLMILTTVCKGQIYLDTSNNKIFSQSTLISGSTGGISFPNLNDCGTWEAQPDYYTEWENVDTIKNKPIKDTIRKWVYSEEKMQVSNTITLEYAPCGNGKSTVWEQYRICKFTGIRQVRFRIRSYKYVPKPKTEYEKVIDSLTNK